jgi:hypothetical protein
MIEEAAVTPAPLSSLKAEDSSSAVSWAAVIAGAFVASAFFLILVTLGTGIGLVSVSPLSGNNPSLATFGVLAALWFIAVQLFASGVGGYLAGRLRARWMRVHDDEVYFRDTAHGLLVWAVGAVVSAALIAWAASSGASGVARLAGAATEAAGAATGQASATASPTAYYADMLLRTDHPGQGDAGAQAEAARIIDQGLLAGELPAGDKAYLAQMVASRAGISQPDAEKRVADVFGQAKNTRVQAAEKAKKAADAARKTGVYVALWAFISLLVGALSASYMATVGGRERDESLPANVA